MSKIPKKPRTSRKALMGAFSGAFGAGTIQMSGAAEALAEILTWALFVNVFGVTPGESMEIDIRELYNNSQGLLQGLILIGGGHLVGWAGGRWKKESRAAVALMDLNE